MRSLYILPLLLIPYNAFSMEDAAQKPNEPAGPQRQQDHLNVAELLEIDEQPLTEHAPYVCKSEEEARRNYDFWQEKGPPALPKGEAIDTSKLRKPVVLPIENSAD